MNTWCELHQIPRGAVITVEKCWTLARAWYNDRLSPDWHRKTPAEMAAVFAQAGLQGPFWSL